MSKIQIEAQPRKKTRKLRAMIDEGFVPGVIYDQTGMSENIKIPSNIVEKLLQEITGTPIVNVILGKTTYITLLKETQKDLRRNVVNHLSFMALNPKKKAQFDVEVSYIGESPAVRNSLGILITNTDTISLRGLPEHVPSHITANTSALSQIGDRITVSDLSIPDELELVHEDDKDFILATIQPFQKTLEEEREEEKLAQPEDEEEVELDADGEPIEGEEGEDEGEKAENTETDSPTEDVDSKE